MEQQSLRDRIEAELKYARDQRALGNEGRARVCARRAAGWAIAAFRYKRLGVKSHPNAYNLLRWFQGLADVPREYRMAAARLTTRVTTDYKLPHLEDPLDDARYIVEAVLR
jgi:hypothetical protein